MPRTIGMKRKYTPRRQQPFKKPRRMKTYPKKRSANARTGGLLAIERKFNDDLVTPQTLNPASWSFIDPSTPKHLTSIAQGDGPSQRDGRQVVINSLFIRGRCVNNRPYGARVRIAIVLDTQTNGSVPVADEVYMFPNAGTEIDSFRNLEWTQRYKVLYDKTFTLNAFPFLDGVGGIESSRPVKNFEVNLTNLNIRQQYKDTGGELANVTDNSFHIMAVSDNSDLSVEYQSRCRFQG